MSTRKSRTNGSSAYEAASQALKVEPTERYQTAAEMSTDIGRINISVDWEVTNDPVGTTWALKRPPQPDLVVRMEREVAGTWKVDVYTQGATRRARNASAFAVRGKTEKEALKHLNDVVLPALP
jgi:hypothetical protein